MHRANRHAKRLREPLNDDHNNYYVKDTIFKSTGFGKKTGRFVKTINVSVIRIFFSFLQQFILI